MSPINFGTTTTDVDEASHLIGSIYAPVTVRPPGPRFELSIDGTMACGVTAARVSSRFEAEVLHRAAFPGFALALPSKGCIESASPGGAVRSDAGTASFVGGPAPCRTRCSGHFEMTAILLEAGLVETRISEQLGRTLRKPVEFTRSFDGAGATAKTLQSLAAALMHGSRGQAPLQAAPLAVASLHSTILDLVVHGIAHNHSDEMQRPPGPRALPRHVRRAIEFMQAHVASPLTTAEIAAAAGTSARALQDAFHRFLDTTPKAYLRDLRLAGVQRDLLDPANPSSVAAVALAWGFVHMSMFAARYRRRFGELPSETRRRSR